MRYTLAPRAAVARARALAASESAAVALPAWLVAVLAAQLGLASRAVAFALGAVIAALAITRGVVSYGRARRRLVAMAIEHDASGLTFHGVRAASHVPPGAIARVVEVDGAFGGLRLELSDESLPAHVDVPRGGDAFGELRALIAGWAPIERAPRRGWRARAAVVAIVVLALFFVPFVVADVRGSHMAAAIALIAAWGAARIAVARS